MRTMTVDCRSPVLKAFIWVMMSSAGRPVSVGTGPFVAVRGWQPVQEVAPRGGAASAGAVASEPQRRQQQEA